jgi:predicted N-acetyltransferase YhbS
LGAVDDGDVVGHILFSQLAVGDLVGAALGPMAAVPVRQRQGIGSRLVEAGIERLRAARCPFIVVIGPPAFYPRFGFEPAAGYSLTCEWDVPPEAFMVKVLAPKVSKETQFPLALGWARASACCRRARRLERTGFGGAGSSPATPDGQTDIDRATRRHDDRLRSSRSSRGSLTSRRSPWPTDS